AIGMCLTGGFALGAIINEKVKAAVLCQPSYPFATKIHTLGFSGPQIKCIKERAEAEQGTLAKGYRYAGDFISRESHMKAAENMLGERFERYPDLPGREHSTLTSDSFSQAVYDDCLAFLGEKLG
ncbi:MAG: dienelactone hydrolase, partial [Pseudomonadota bacterium]